MNDSDDYLFIEIKPLIDWREREREREGMSRMAAASSTHIISRGFSSRFRCFRFRGAPFFADDFARRTRRAALFSSLSSTVDQHSNAHPWTRAGDDAGITKFWQRRLISSRERALDRKRIFDRYLVSPSVKFEDDYELLKKLGSGGFGNVYAGKDKTTGAPVAVKIQSIDSNPWCHRELEMQSHLHHTRCTPILHAYVQSQKLYLVTPAWKEDLYDHLIRVGPLEERRAFVMCEQVLQAAEACHRAGFAHLDIKPENIMIKGESNPEDLVLIDFGSAEPFRIAEYAETSEDYDPAADDRLVGIDRVSGTALYQSPEIALHEKFSSRSDVWSVGILLYICITGEAPYSLTMTGESIKGHGSNSKTLQYDNDVLDHPVLGDEAVISSRGKSILNSLMDLSPAERPSASEARKMIAEHLADMDSK